MDNIYTRNVKYFKALSDTNRLLIVDMLSCGEMCACKILEKFNITQPTLSHHMKILSECDLVCGRQEGKWTHYSLNEKSFEEFKDFLNMLSSPKDECICNCEEVCNCE